MAASDSLLDELVGFYGKSEILPNRAQWAAIIESNNTNPIIIVNSIKIREIAAYPDGSESSGSGMDAMMRYGELSQRKVMEYGGEFLVQGLFGQVVIGDDEAWDVVGIVRYPSREAFINLFTDPEYQAGHHHRVAATLRHKMVLVDEL